MNELTRLFWEYLDHAFAFINGVEIVNQHTGHRTPPDVTFLVDVESLCGCVHWAGPDFRKHITLQATLFVVQKKEYDVFDFPLLYAGIVRYCDRKQLRETMANLARPNRKSPAGEFIGLDELKSTLQCGLGKMVQQKFTSEGGFCEQN